MEIVKIPRDYLILKAVKYKRSDIEAILEQIKKAPVEGNMKFQPHESKNE